MNALIPTNKNKANDNSTNGGDFFFDLYAFDLKNNVEKINTVKINISKT
jgi:hypothetical protein